ncbi:MAG TPA: type VII secretion protein EccB [Stackebrandtia sp.]|jgi:type VII secretion protein EccB|uniref:type VII secretion protein EccB n=1 Tax=Stackebrandtia sp. TaxID=2023065 RepID=UPI002D44D760|nr:type VII secretion protein EccB [Stackebrandtia sp.]HZE38068.1 type VII secretion protein EccB [Stackebrandtia sp.]
MASRRDQLQSYQFLLQRVVSALVYRKTDPAQSPFRRTGGAVFAGIMLAALALAITAVIGLFASNFGKDRDWVLGNKVIMDEDTGTPYVVLPPAKDEKHQPKNQVLYPVTNFASAALLAGTTEKISVSSNSLAGEDEDLGDLRIPPRGTPIGIVGAPQSLPTSDLIIDDPWTLCSKPSAGGDSYSSKLFIGSMSGVTGSKLASNEALLISDGDDTYMLVDGKLHLIDPDLLDQAGTNLAWDPKITLPVDAAFTDGINKGDPVEFPDLGGTPGDSVSGGGTIGTVHKNAAAGGTVYLAQTKDGFARVTEFQAEILKAATNQDGYESGGASQTDDLQPTKTSDSLPANMPKFPTVDSSAPTQTCATYTKTGKVTVNHDVTFKHEVPGVKTTNHDDTGKKYVNRIVMKPGTGAIVETGSALSLVTSDGAIFGLDQTKPAKTKSGKYTPPNSAIVALGYSSGVAKVHMPTNLISLIPPGPELSPQRALDAATKEQ